MKTSLLLFGIALALPAWAGHAANRTTLPLDGTWTMAESVAGDPPPASFPHRAPVPGLANLAEPPFPDVDLFDSKELIANRVRKHELPESARVDGAGTPRQARNYFWYRREFRAPAEREVAMLRINKAQFGTAVWLNGTKLGEHAGCFTAGVFDVTPAVKWKAVNTLIVRVGAHPAVLPATYPAGTDFEKLKWTPGIYDRVAIAFCDNPVVDWVQVAPRLADSVALVQTRLRNRGDRPVTANVWQEVRAWRKPGVVAAAAAVPVTVPAGGILVLTQTVAIANARLWTPETPFLYELETRTGSDALKTRFGMREFHGDAQSRRFLLNGKPYYLRGSNITLHRFFEDPGCGGLPWDERWLRRLLVEVPKEMHWNSFRFCIGPVPDRWLEIADEAGLLIQNEFFIWTGAPSWDTNYSRAYDVPEMIRQYAGWLRDNWNHPSVAIWDANNESVEPLFGREIVPAVRGLDLSRRPWENSYNEPLAPDDPVEHHPYLSQSTDTSGEIKFRMSDLETLNPAPKIWHYPRHDRPVLINEYGWLWLNRDGSPTLLTRKLYPLLLGPDSTADQRFALNAYMLAGKTEYWRASRQYAGILHFVYLTGSYPGVYTADHWQDLKRLRLEPHFADYVAEAFKPLGVYVNFFQPTLAGGEAREFDVRLVNDLDTPARGELRLTLENAGGQVLASTARPFELPPLGDDTLRVTLVIPPGGRPCVLQAAAKSAGSREGPTRSRRWVEVP